MRLAVRSTVIAGALAATAITASAALARPYDLAPSQPAGGTAQSQTTSHPSVVRPHADQQVRQASQVGPPALQSATASQLPEVHRPQTAGSHAFAYKPAASAGYSHAALNGLVRPPTTAAPAVVHVAMPGHPFHWGDAAIGAAAGLAISLLIVSGGIIVTRRRHPKPSRTKVLA